MDAAAEMGSNSMSKHQIQPRVWRMSRLARDGTTDPVSLDQIITRKRGQGNIDFPLSADHEQDWQPDPIDPYSAISHDHTFLPFSVLMYWLPTREFAVHGGQSRLWSAEQC